MPFHYEPAGQILHSYHSIIYSQAYGNNTESNYVCDSHNILCSFCCSLLNRLTVGLTAHYSSCFISVLNLDLYVCFFDALIS